MPVPNDNVLSPSQLNALARSLLEDAFPLVLVEGEIGNLARPASGHVYLTLKDARAQVRCALFKPKSQRLRFQPRDGLQVMARGRSEERRVGKECVRTCRSRWSADH